MEVPDFMKRDKEGWMWGQEVVEVRERRLLA